MTPVIGPTAHECIYTGRTTAVNTALAGADRLSDVTLPLVKALTAAWDAIRDRHPDVPAVVVTIGAGSIGEKAGSLRLGHFAAGRWQIGEDIERAELFIAGEGLKSGAEDVLAIMLHEAAHGAAHTRGIQETSRQGRYHNGAFKKLAEELGLTVASDPRIGWSPSTLAAGTAEAYAPELADLSVALVAFRHPEPPRGGRDRNTKDTNLKAAVCGCGRKIRVAAATLEAAPITCGACGEAFTIPEEN